MRYMISANAGPFGETVRLVYETDPEKAVFRWFRYSGQYPMCASIQPKTTDDGLELLQWAGNNAEKLEEWGKKYHCPYRTDWLKEQIEHQVLDNEVSMQWDYDQLYPFCVG